MDKKTSNLMIIHRALHHRDDVDRPNVSGKEGGRGFAGIEDRVDALIKRLEEKRGGRSQPTETILMTRGLAKRK